MKEMIIMMWMMQKIMKINEMGASVRGKSAKERTLKNEPVPLSLSCPKRVLQGTSAHGHT